MPRSSLSTVLVHPDGATLPSWATSVVGDVMPSHLLENGVARTRLADIGCVLVDATSTEFIGVARRVHDADQSVQVVAVTPPAHVQATRRALLYAPGLGEVWIASPTDVTGALAERAAGVTRQRRRFERMRERIGRDHISVSPQRAERAIISDAYLAGLLVVLPDPVFSVDAAGRIVSANAAAERILGGAGHHLVGARLRAVLGDDAASADDRALLERASGTEPVMTTFMHADGRRGTGELRAAPMRGDIGGWAVVLRDITEERETFERLQDTYSELEASNEELQSTTEELMQRTEEAETANRAKSDFLAVMSHELRTPLNAIAGYAQLLELGIHGPISARQRDALGRIQRSERHLLGLINDLLNFAKLEAGHVEYHTARVSIRDLFDTLEPLVSPQLSAKSLQFERRVSSEDLAVLADADKAQQILINLVSNAIKFTAARGTVRLEAARAGDEVRITVHDTGMGIPADRLEHIFEPFIQIARRLNAPHEGTGLGLAISRDLARGMGGDLVAESTPGVGSAFTVTLPVAVENAAAPRQQAASR